MDLATLHSFEDEIRKEIPDFKISYKNESLFMKVLGFLTMPFNPQFMTRYTTTIGNTVYFPSKEDYESTPKPSFTVLAHELVHMMDDRNNKWTYAISYAFPQLLALPLFILFTVLAGLQAWPLLILIAGALLGCWAAKKSNAAFWIVTSLAFAAASTLLIVQTHWISVLYFLALLGMAPWPAPWRTKWEGRGYTMTLAVLEWTVSAPPAVLLDVTVKHFTGPDYYFMSWAGKDVATTLRDGIWKAATGELQKEQPYGMVYDFLAAHGDLRAGKTATK
jgi:hypothetical protein